MAPDDDADDVLSRLPRTRPARRSARREGAPATDAAAAGQAPPKRPAKPAAARPKTPPKPRAKAAPKAAEPPPPPPRPSIEPPSAAEILGSAAQAAGDLARVGLVVGREALKAVVSRLPRP